MRLIRLLKKDLAVEASTWVDNRLITVEQARAICRLYGIDYDAIRNHSSAYRILVVLGFLFVGLSLITLIGANWDAIPRAARMTGLLVLTAGTHGWALHLHRSDKSGAAAGLFFLGNLFYGASIILIAQIYHLGEHIPDGVFVWALGSLPFAVLLCNPWLTVLSGVLALVWFFLEIATGFLSATLSVMAFPVFLIAELYVLARGRANILLFLMFLASLVLWFETVLAMIWTDGRNPLEYSSEHAFVVFALFILAYAVGHWLHRKESAKARDLGAVLSLWTLRFALLALLVLSFESPWERLLAADWDHQVSMWAVAAAIAAAALWIGSKARNFRLLLGITVVCGATMIAVIATGAATAAVYFQVITNVALVAAGIGLIFLGTSGGISHYYFLGVATILLTAFMRYADLIGDYVDSAVLFIGLAGVLLGAARYWKYRSRDGTAS